MKLNTKTKNYLKNKTSGYVSKNQKFEDLSGYIRLDLGENLLGSVNITDNLKFIDKDILAYYADPSNTKIKKTIAYLYNLATSNVTIANSTNEIIDFLPRMIMEKGSKSLIVLPSFFRFLDTSLLMESKITYVSLLKENGFKPNSSIINNICNVSKKNNLGIIWICNPNNPTGEVYEIEDIEKIAKISSSFIVIDEAFFEFYDPENKNSAIKLVNKYKNIIVLRTLSKAYGLAGLRFGYAVAHPKTIETIEKYRDTLLMTSGLVVKLASVALKDQQFIKKTAERTRNLKQELYSRISELRNLEIGSNTKTNIFILRHKKKNIYKELLQKGILTADFTQSKGIEGMGYARITIADEVKNERLIESLKEID